MANMLIFKIYMYIQINLAKGIYTHLKQTVKKVLIRFSYYMRSSK